VTSSLWQALYSNEYGLADSFGAFWANAAETFKGNPNVLGFGWSVGVVVVVLLLLLLLLLLVLLLSL
jgi:hypothetical protein